MLLIDKRVGSRELAELSDELPVGSYTLTDLEAGDVAFLGYGPDGPLTYPVGIERKAYYDLVQCFEDGRLNSQIRTMSQLYRRIYLIVEGRPRTTPDRHLLVPRQRSKKVEWVESRLTYASIDNYLNTLTDEYHVQVKRSFSLKETIWEIQDIFAHCSSERHSSHLKLDTTWQINPFQEPSFKKRVAIQLDGIGELKSDEVIAHFGCVLDMANSPEEEWRKISGIGKVLARKIVNQFRGVKT